MSIVISHQELRFERIDNGFMYRLVAGSARSRMPRTFRNVARALGVLPEAVTQTAIQEAI